MHLNLYLNKTKLTKLITSNNKKSYGQNIIQTKLYSIFKLRAFNLLEVTCNPIKMSIQRFIHRE